MNILLVNMSIDLKSGGGTAERTYQLSNALNQLPATHAKVLATNAGIEGEAPLKKADCILLPCLNARWYIPAPFFIKVYKAIRWSDIIVITGHWTLLNIMVYMVNKLLSRPYLFNPAGALHVFGRSGIFKRIYQTLFGYGMLKNAARMVAIPKEEANFFYELGVSRDKISVIPNGISMHDFSSQDDNHFREKFKIPDKPFILFMGRLNAIKGPDILLQAFVQIAGKSTDIQLVMAGPDDGMYRSLKETAQKHQLSDRVHFIGYVSGAEKSEAYHAAEMLVVPSRLEAMSIVALESSACATPVIMTDVCGFSELQEAGGGLEVAVSVAALQDAMAVLLADSRRLQSMGMRAQVLIRREYTWDMAALKYRDICRTVLQEHMLKVG